MSRDALGLIETKGLIASILATDAASKAAAVVVTSAELTDAAFMTIRIEGELGAVQAAVDAGARAAQQIGELIAAHVIPRPDDNLNVLFPHRRYVSKYHPDEERPPLTFTVRPPRPLAPSGSTGAQPHTPSAKKPPTPISTAQKPQVVPPTPTRPVAPPAKSTETVKRLPATKAPTGPAKPAEGSISQAELDTMPVRVLRQFARTIANLPIKGRQISIANRQEIIAAIKQVMRVE